MKCTACGGPKSRVVDSRPDTSPYFAIAIERIERIDGVFGLGWVVRRRHCRACGSHFRTIEVHLAAAEALAAGRGVSLVAALARVERGVEGKSAIEAGAFLSDEAERLGVPGLARVFRELHEGLAFERAVHDALAP